MCDMVDKYINNNEVVMIETERLGIKKDIYRNLKNTKMTKRFRVINKKRVIRKDLLCVPFGYNFKQ